MALSDDNGSPEVLDLARHYLERCAADHPKCASVNNEVNLPTRVIDVGSGEHAPFLFVTNESQGRYCALSYCWGGGNNFAVTNTSNLKERTQSIDMSNGSLPRTIRDAILSTRRLGDRYLWIDGLCIVQDDPAD